MCEPVLTRHPYLAGPHPRAFAHRGWHLDRLTGMENSLAACRRAVAEGFHYLELDVRTTKDGEVVVLHDPTLDRTTDGTGTVAELPWSTVRRARVGGVEPVCRLVDLIEELPDTFLNIDVKDDASVLPTVGVLRATDHWDKVCLAGFSDRRLARLRAEGGPRLLTAMGPRAALLWWSASWLPGLTPSIAGAAAQVPTCRRGLRVVTRHTVAAAHRWRKEVHVWTIDDVATMIALLDIGVDGLVTDRPDLLRSVLRERGTWPAG